jgi:hypothetical protein
MDQIYQMEHIENGRGSDDNIWLLSSLHIAFQNMLRNESV